MESEYENSYCWFSFSCSRRRCREVVEQISEQIIMDIVRQIIWAKNKARLKFPFTGTIDQEYFFGIGEYADIMSFGFSFVEHEDHLVEFIVANPETVKKIIQEIDPVQLTVGQEYIGMLWTGKIYVTDKLIKDQILFANADLSVILDLDINKTEEV